MCEPAAQSRRRQDGPHATPALEFYRAFEFYRALLAKIFKNRPGPSSTKTNHVLPSSHCINSLALASALIAARMPNVPCCTNVAEGLLLDAGSALAKGGQVMFRPQPLHQLPSLGICAPRCSTNVAYRRFANTLLLVGIWHNYSWQSLGNRVAILLRRDESCEVF